MELLNFDSKKLSYSCIVIPLIILCMISSVFIGTSILFVLKVSITKINIVIFPIITLMILKKVLKKDGQEFKWIEMLIILLIFFFLLVLLSFISNIIWDYTYDSRAYHQIGIMKLKEGWNPFYNPAQGENLWVKHYTKAPWIFAACIFKLTGYIETGKVLSVLIPILLSVMVYGISFELTKGKKLKSILISLMMFLNPIVTGQLFTYYIDSLLASYIIFLIIILYMIVFSKEYKYFKYFCLFNIAIFMCNIKFTGLAYGGAILLVFFIYTLKTGSKKQKTNVFLYLFTSLIITVGIVGFNPYITNTVTNKHPFYPLSGEGKVDIMTPNTPSNLKGDLEINKLIKSYIGKPSIENIDGYRTDFKYMFKIDKGVLDYYSGVDCRIRGFGIYSTIFMPLAFLIMIVLLIKCKNKKFKLFTLGILIAILAIVILGGDYWWARYVGFFWIIPVVVTSIMIESKNNINKLVGLILMAMIIVSSTIILPTMTKNKINSSNAVKNEFFNKSEILRFLETDNFTTTNINKAKEYNLNYEIYKKEE